MPNNNQKVEPDVEKKVNAYVSGLSKLLHGKETKDHVYGMLQSGDPMQTIPATAMQINDQMETAFKQKGQKPDLDTLAAGASFLVADLIEIGNAGGFFEIPEDQNIVGQLLTSTMQPYIEKGLADGSIDPVELQEKVEPLMDKGKASQLNKLGSTLGQPDQAGERAAMAQSRQQGILEERKRADNQLNKARTAQPSGPARAQAERPQRPIVG